MLPFKTARVNGRRWELKIVEHIDDDTIGLCDHANRRILLQDGEVAKIQDALFHELVHAACPSLTEEQVAEVERGVYAVLADNPKIRRWLFKNAETG